MNATRRAVPAAFAALVLAVACSKGSERDATSVTTDAVQMAAPEAAPGGDASGAAMRTPPPPVNARPGRAMAAAAPEEAAAPTQPGSQAAGDTTSVVATSMLIRTGNATIEVDSLEPAIAAVQALAQRLGGYVANTSLLAGEGQARRATLELKVPAARFEQATSGLQPIGKVEGLDIHTEDVGEEFVDVTARVANARRLEARLVELLARRTGKLEEVLQVERELARVREEIERYEGRLRYLRTRTSLSTLTVTVHEPRPVFEPRPGPSRIGEAFRDAWRNFVNFLAGFIAMLGWLVPLAVVVGLLAWAWRRWMPRRPPPSRPTPDAPPPLPRA